MIQKIQEFIQTHGAKQSIFIAVLLIALCVGGYKVLVSSEKNSTGRSDKPASSEVTTSPDTVKDFSGTTEDEPVSNEQNTAATPEATATVTQENKNGETKPAVQAIVEYLESTGDYGGFIAEEDEKYWDITDLSQFADKDPNFTNLFCYVGYGEYSHDVSDDLDGITADHKSGDDVCFTCYATKNDDGSVNIHYVSRTGKVLLNDRFVTDQMMRIMNDDEVAE